MPIWNEKLQKWGYLYHEEVFSFQWLGIRRDKMSEEKEAKKVPEPVAKDDDNKEEIEGTDDTDDDTNEDVEDDEAVRS